jgi:predicted NBD/HSP70 family sugar kinase
MAKRKDKTPTLPVHGARVLPAVKIDSYKVETPDENGFLGDRASKGAFRETLARLHKLLPDDDSFAGKDLDEMSYRKLDAVLIEGPPAGAAIVLGAIEEFSQDFAQVIRRFLNLKDWKKTECIVIGGGMRASRLGELIVARTEQKLREDIDIRLTTIRNDPDEAGLIGSVHLVPAWILKGHGAILAVDIGGTNIRAGIVELHLRASADLAKARVRKYKLWRHGDEKVTREKAVARLIDMLNLLIKKARRKKLRLAPFIGVGCPGSINEDGTIESGAQNLPGNWHSRDFNLPQLLREAIPTIDGQEVGVILHNDAVVQGLSEVPFMREVNRWGVLTIGTGLGNARFTNRDPDH